MTDIPLKTDALLMDAVRAIERSPRRIAVVVDDAGKVVGTFTDGDVRRCLLAGGSLETPAVEAMNPNPVVAPVGCSSQHIFELFKKYNIMVLPLVDQEGRYVRLVHLSELSGYEQGACQEECFREAVIMAGGEGRRLRPLTENIPKPMVEVGGIPLLERQIRRLVMTGVTRLYLAVNYLGHVIEDYFGDGAKFGLEIVYLREKRRLGTAGALSLVPSGHADPLLVMNGDVLTTSDFMYLYQFHIENQAQLTVSATEYNLEIPYGVLETRDSAILALREKPSQRFLCNAGIYSLSRELLDLVPKDRYYDMSEFIRDCLAGGQKVVAFPLHEYWSDVGTARDLEKARAFFAEKASWRRAAGPPGGD